MGFITFLHHIMPKISVIIFKLNGFFHKITFIIIVKVI